MPLSTKCQLHICTMYIVSVIFLVEETGVARETHRPAPSHWQILSDNVISSTPHHEWNSNSQR